MLYNFEVTYYCYDTQDVEKEFPTIYADTLLDAYSKICKMYKSLQRKAPVEIVHIEQIHEAKPERLWGYIL